MLTDVVVGETPQQQLDWISEFLFRHISLRMNCNPLTFHENVQYFWIYDQIAGDIPIRVSFTLYS